MLRLKPRDVPSLTLLGRHGTKAHEGAHLVHVAAHRFVHLGEQMDVGIDDEVEQVPLPVRLPEEDAVEQRPALRVTVAGHPAGHVDKRAGYSVDLRRRCLGGLFLVLFEHSERGLRIVKLLPVDGRRRHASLQGAPRRLLPRSEGRSEGDLFHVTPQQRGRAVAASRLEAARPPWARGPP